MKNMQVNPLQIMQMIQNGQNPEQIVLKIFQDNIVGNNPIAANLIDLAKNNRTSEIEKVARNLCAERGIDFDKEFNNFKSNLFKDIKS